MFFIMEILLESKEREDVIGWMVSILEGLHSGYMSKISSCDKGLYDTISILIANRICDKSVHICEGHVRTIGNVLCDYTFCINGGDVDEDMTGTYRIIRDEEDNDHFIDGWFDWSLWEEFDKCLEKACSIFMDKIESQLT